MYKNRHLLQTRRNHKTIFVFFLTACLQPSSLTVLHLKQPHHSSIHTSTNPSRTTAHTSLLRTASDQTINPFFLSPYMTFIHPGQTCAAAWYPPTHLNLIHWLQSRTRTRFRRFCRASRCRFRLCYCDEKSFWCEGRAGKVSSPWGDRGWRWLWMSDEYRECACMGEKMGKSMCGIAESIFGSAPTLILLVLLIN